MVFLPWRPLDGLTENGFRNWGLLTFIMSILGIGISFVAVPRFRSLGTILIGVLAIIGIAVYWSRLKGIMPGYGIIIAMIASLGLIAAGYLEYRKLEQPAKPGQPSPPSPPPQ